MEIWRYGDIQVRNISESIISGIPRISQINFAGFWIQKNDMSASLGWGWSLFGQNVTTDRGSDHWTSPDFRQRGRVLNLHIPHGHPLGMVVQGLKVKEQFKSQK